MDLKQVKEHFKDAKEVRCLDDGNVYNLDDMTERGIHKLIGGYWFDTVAEKNKGFCCLWRSEEQGFAEVISYKKDAKRIKEDCELLDNFYRSLPASYLELIRNISQFKKDNGLIIEPTELEKLKQSHAELMEKAEEIKQQMDKLK